MTGVEKNVYAQLNALFRKDVPKTSEPSPMVYVDGHVKEQGSFTDHRTGRQVIVERR